MATELPFATPAQPAEPDSLAHIGASSRQALLADAEENQLAARRQAARQAAASAAAAHPPIPENLSELCLDDVFRAFRPDEPASNEADVLAGSPPPSAEAGVELRPVPSLSQRDAEPLPSPPTTGPGPELPSGLQLGKPTPPIPRTCQCCGKHRVAGYMDGPPLVGGFYCEDCAHEKWTSSPGRATWHLFEKTPKKAGWRKSPGNRRTAQRRSPYAAARWCGMPALFTGTQESLMDVQVAVVLMHRLNLWKAAKQAIYAKTSISIAELTEAVHVRRVTVLESLERLQDQHRIYVPVGPSRGRNAFDVYIGVTAGVLFAPALAPQRLFDLTLERLRKQPTPRSELARELRRLERLYARLPDSTEKPSWQELCRRLLAAA